MPSCRAAPRPDSRSPAARAHHALEALALDDRATAACRTAPRVGELLPAGSASDHREPVRIARPVTRRITSWKRSVRRLRAPGRRASACSTEIERSSSASTAVASARVSSMPRALAPARAAARRARAARRRTRAASGRMAAATRRSRRWRSGTRRASLPRVLREESVDLFHAQLRLAGRPASCRPRGSSTPCFPACAPPPRGHSAAVWRCGSGSTWHWLQARRKASPAGD